MDAITAAAQSQRATAEKLAETRKRLLGTQRNRSSRAAARRRLPGRVATGKPSTQPSSRKRIPGGVAPGQNNPNDIGAVIIPQGTPPL